MLNHHLGTRWNHLPSLVSTDQIFRAAVIHPPLEVSVFLE